MIYEVVYTNFKYRGGALIPLVKENVEFIFIHHPAWERATPQQIHDDVLADPKKVTWRGFPYNEYITDEPKVYIGRGDFIGAHTENHNSKSYGIAVQGNFNVQPAPPDYLMDIVAERVVKAQRRFPNAKVVLPHSARNNTDCPGKNFPMGKLYDAISKIYKRMDQIETKLHWVEEKGIIRRLKDDYGVEIHEKRYDEPITRAESFSMNLRLLDAMKKLIDEGR
jgi:N-acetylmuramoyl-L-alanine amidase